MKELEYKRLRQHVEAEYKKKLQALELVWKLSNERESKNGNANGGSSRGRLLKAVRHSLAAVADQFTIHDVERAIRLNDPALGQNLKRTSISSALKRLADQKTVEIVQAGTGKRPSTYRKAA